MFHSTFLHGPTVSPRKLFDDIEKKFSSSFCHVSVSRIYNHNSQARIVPLMNAEQVRELPERLMELTKATEEAQKEFEASGLAATVTLPGPPPSTAVGAKKAAASTHQAREEGLRRGRGRPRKDGTYTFRSEPADRAEASVDEVWTCRTLHFSVFLVWVVVFLARDRCIV